MSKFLKSATVLGCLLVGAPAGAVTLFRVGTPANGLSVEYIPGKSAPRNTLSSKLAHLSVQGTRVKLTGEKTHFTEKASKFFVADSLLNGKNELAMDVVPLLAPIIAKNFPGSLNQEVGAITRIPIGESWSTGDSFRSESESLLVSGLASKEGILLVPVGVKDPKVDGGTSIGGDSQFHYFKLNESTTNRLFREGKDKEEGIEQSIYFVRDARGRIRPVAESEKLTRGEANRQLEDSLKSGSLEPAYLQVVFKKAVESLALVEGKDKIEWALGSNIDSAGALEFHVLLTREGKPAQALKLNAERTGFVDAAPEKGRLKLALTDGRVLDATRESAVIRKMGVIESFKEWFTYRRALLSPRRRLQAAAKDGVENLLQPLAHRSGALEWGNRDAAARKVVIDGLRSQFPSGNDLAVLVPAGQALSGPIRAELKYKVGAATEVSTMTVLVKFSEALIPADDAAAQVVIRSALDKAQAELGEGEKLLTSFSGMAGKELTGGSEVIYLETVAGPVKLGFILTEKDSAEAGNPREIALVPTSSYLASAASPNLVFYDSQGHDVARLRLDTIAQAPAVKNY